MYEGENTIWEQRVGREENNIKNGLKCTMDSSGSGHVLETGCCERGYESSSFINIDRLLTKIFPIRSLFHKVNVKNTLII
jgi:hypothetical protein